MDIEQRIAQLSPTQLALLELKLNKGKVPAVPEPTATRGLRQRFVPLSFAQERLWFLEQMEPDTCVYNLPAVLPLRRAVSPRLVEEAVTQIAARHGALRTRFVVRDGSPYQSIEDDPGRAVDFSTVDLRPHRDPSLLRQVLNQHIWVPFNLGSGPLLRVRLILQPNNENVLLVVMHHAISDGWSINLFLKEFKLLYQAAESGTAADLPSVQQYVDYSIAQREWLEGEPLKSLLAYWRSQLDGAPSVLELPLDRPRPARQTFNGALHPFFVPSAIVDHLKLLCRESGVVPFMVLLSVFNALLFRYTGQERVVVGTPIANRNRTEFENVIGLFTNTLVLCTSVSGNMTFRDLLADIRQKTLEAYEHQDLPFEKLVSELRVDRSLSNNPLFQVMFTFQNLPVEKDGSTDAAPRAEPGILDAMLSKFDLTLALTEASDGLSGVFEYATDLFDPQTIDRMAGHFVNMLDFLVHNPAEQLANFSFLSAREADLVLNQWNATARHWPDFQPLHRRFEQWAHHTPDALAVIYRDTSLTYSQLDRRANQVAALLREQGAGPGRIVGICLPRSVEMVTGLFGILKAGAAYMPIDPDFPEDRMAYMLQEAGVEQVLTTADCLPIVTPHGVNAIALDQLDVVFDGPPPPPSDDLGPKDVAYVIFTSGSTGRPKGVMISHGAIYNRLQWMQQRYGLQTDDRVMQKTPFTFDVSVWEFFWTLSEGACLVVAEPERHKESAYLVDLIKTQGITCLHFVPSMLQLFLCEDLTGCVSLRRIICSGEALTIQQCRNLQALDGVEAHNLYGPTEAAVDVTHWDCSEWRNQYLSVPIGRPIANTQIYILNDRLQPVPIGVPGELYIGGHNLAEGYLNNPELTAEKFIRNPFAGSDGSPRLYKTGDLARFRGDGNIEYVGRRDSQVKLRGVRIELGEIESVLGQFPGVGEAVAVVTRFADQDERLAAYVVVSDQDTPLDPAAISAFAARQLPSYMVPAYIVPVHELPLSQNGKLDRKRLPDPVTARPVQPTAPVGDIEKELLDIWRKFLKTEAVIPSDDFFALGGHSILATQVVNRINGHFQLNVPVRILFENPTVRSLARALTESEQEAWFHESATADLMLARSTRRLLQRLDDLTEEELDDVLDGYVERAPLTSFGDVKSLLSWARTDGTSRGGARRPASDPGVSRLAATELSAYERYCSELVRTRLAIEQLSFGHSHGFVAAPATEGLEGIAATLCDQSEQIFDGFVGEMKEQLTRQKGGTLHPYALTAYCREMLVMADLAIAVRSFRGLR
jgi:amino acid adenylation domain-containing protein